jgi:hypothetical protein
MWEQRNDILHNTLHPRRAAEVLAIKNKLRSLYRKGTTGFSPNDRLLLSKSEAKLLKGEPTEMIQWITSVLHASRRAAQAKTDEAATMQSERDQMRGWLTQA